MTREDLRARLHERRRKEAREYEKGQCDSTVRTLYAYFSHQRGTELGIFSAATSAFTNNARGGEDGFEIPSRNGAGGIGGEDTETAGGWAGQNTHI